MTLGVLAGLVVVAATLVAVVGVPILREYPATVSAPDAVSGLEKVKRPDLQRQADKLSADLKSEVGADTAVAAFYSPAGDLGHLVVVASATTLILNPDVQLEEAFTSAAGSDMTVTGVRAVSAGKLGGSVRCGSGTVQNDASNVPVGVCGWADHGSVGVGVFFNRSATDSAALFNQVREGVLRRG